MNELQKSSPWVAYARKLNAFFAGDPCVTVDLSEVDSSRLVRITVTGNDKYDALKRLLPESKIFGSAELQIELSARQNERSYRELFNAALSGNSCFSRAVEACAMGGLWTYVEFKPDVAQYMDDNLGDLNGMTSALYADLARDLFGEVAPGVFLSTDEPSEVD